MNFSPIQVFPTGFLGFLQMKSNGKNPYELPSTMQATIELFNWLMQTQQTRAIGTDAAIAAVGNAVYHTVPAGKAWWVHEVQANIGLAAAATWCGAPSFALQPGGFGPGFDAPMAPLRQYSQTVEGSTIIVPNTLFTPLFLVAGGEIGIRTTALSAATTSGNIVVRYTEFPM